jgi:hypothetical protein
MEWCFFKRITQKRNRDFGSNAGGGNNQSSIGLHFSLFQPIDFPWDNSTVYETNASDAERIWSAKRQRCEPARHQASSGQRRNPLRKSEFDLIPV